MSIEDYISTQEAAHELGVAESTMYYYYDKFGIDRVKFALDKEKYILRSDFQRILDAKLSKQKRKREPDRP